MNKYATSLRQVNNALHKVHPLVDLVRGNGYYYIQSDNEAMALKIAGLFTSSIPVCSIKQQTVEQWVKDVSEMLRQDEQDSTFHHLFHDNQQ